MNSKTKSPKTKGFLGWVEKVGNKLPHPFILFLILIIAVLIISFIGGKAGWQQIDPKTGEMTSVKNLISGEGAEFMLTSAVGNFVGFAPLGLVLTMTLGIGLCEEIGLMSTFMRKTILGASPKLMTFIIMFIGINGNIASDAAIVIIPSLAAMIFLSTGRNPLAGIALGYAGTTAGFSANVLIAGTDSLLQGITNSASDLISGPHIDPTANWFFMIVSTFMLTIVGGLISEKIVEPRLGPYKGSKVVEKEEVTPEENKALKSAGIGLLTTLTIIIILAIPENSFLRSPETGSLISGSILLKGIIPILLILFLSAGIPYGVSIGKIKSSGDVPKYMTKAIGGMSSFIVLAFVIGQFIAYFNWSNLGLVLAVSGANILDAAGFKGIPLFIAFIILTAFVNLFIGSGSAKWSILAPIFVPMFTILGYNPAWTQLLYRIGDSCTNVISPLFPYFPIILGFMQQYDEESGVGTLISLMLPFSMIMLVTWVALAMVWYLTGLPIGPGQMMLI